MAFLSVLNLLILGLVSSTLYVISLAFYRLFLHPLAKFPGPKLGAATYWYDFYHDVLVGPAPGQGVYNIEKLHEKYGPVVRINPDEISVKDPDWFDTLYNSGRRDKWPRNHKANGSPGSIAQTVSRDHHKIRRAPLSPFFSKRSVNTLEPIVKHKVELLCTGIKTFMEQDKILPIGTAFTAVTLDVISDYCFAQSWNCLTMPDFAPQWKKAMVGLFEPVPVVKQFPWINQIMMQLPKWLVVKIAPEVGMFLGAKDAVQGQIERIIQEREEGDVGGFKAKPVGNVEETKEETVSRTVFHAVLESNLPDQEKTVERLTDEGFVMIVAGAETTAKVLTMVIYHLLDNPDWLKRVKKELDDAMPEATHLTDSTQLEALPIFSAVVKESLRISSPVTNRLQLIEPIEPLVCQGWSIPPGTPVSMSIPGIHLDPKVHPDPHRFNPERWIQSAKDGANLERYYMPFSRGSRSCLGTNLAYAEIFLATAAVIRRFELQLYDTVRERDVDVVRDCFVGLPSKESKGVRVKVLKERI